LQAQEGHDVKSFERTLVPAMAILFLTTGILASCAQEDTGQRLTFERTISRSALEDKIRGSWTGQMAGVAWGAPTEFRFAGRIIPDNEVPLWTPDWINLAFLQDDVYVEIPFLDAMRESGVQASWSQMGSAFRDTMFPLWHANKAARDNLRNGVPASGSGHYSLNPHCDDIDWQIEADFVGSMCPGLVDQAIDVAWRAGHVMNYGDGALGGVFLAAMHAASFLAPTLADIVQAGRLALPEGSLYRRVVEDVIAWHDHGLTWEQTWQHLQDKWGTEDRCPDFSRGLGNAKNIDAKLNGAYVLIGLLYGNGDLERSMRIAMRCGQDSDCNPSSVGGILGNWVGFSGIPDPFKIELQTDLRFLFTTYTLEDAIAVNLEFAEDVLDLAGAIQEGTGEGLVWKLPPETDVSPPLLEQWPTDPNTPPQLSVQVLSQQGRIVELEAHATDEDGVPGCEWYFGDLRRTRGNRVVHDYASPGIYDIAVCASDSTGNTSWQVIRVTVP
jgi:hypothetical protein